MTLEQFEDAQPIEKAKEAIHHALTRIREDANLGYHAGFATQTFDYLTMAYAALTGKTVDEVQEEFMPEHSDKSNANLLDAMRKAIDQRQSYDITQDEFFTEICRILGR